MPHCLLLGRRCGARRRRCGCRRRRRVRRPLRLRRSHHAVSDAVSPGGWYIYICMYVYVHVYTHVCVYVGMYMYVYIYIYIYIHIYIYIYIYMYIYKSINISPYKILFHFKKLYCGSQSSSALTRRLRRSDHAVSLAVSPGGLPRRTICKVSPPMNTTRFFFFFTLTLTEHSLGLTQRLRRSDHAVSDAVSPGGLPRSIICIY